jgi:hypothetical protein
MADVMDKQAISEKDSIIIGALQKCRSRESLEETFNLYKIADLEKRIDQLNKSMGSPQTFFSSGKISTEETYELTLQMFLTMSWKLNEIYDRMGVGI